MAREVADYNLFMMCASLKREALSPLPVGFSFRNCRPSELDLWKEMHFDNPEEVQAYRGFMDDFFEDTYRAEAQAFFERTLFACDPHGRPVGTCLLWPAYGKLNTLHWLKVVKGYEGLGLGRALISAVLKDLSDADFPVYLHTQPGSFRAIKLYADFGFQVLQDPQIDNRKNEWAESMPYLREHMPAAELEKLTFTSAPKDFLEIVAAYPTVEF